MANFIKVCMDCKKELSRTPSKVYKVDVTSHGLCAGCEAMENAKIDKWIKEKSSNAQKD